VNAVFLYGPPASGKLTVARALAALTGYPVFHNHVVRDLVQSLYPDTLAEHYDLVHELRNDVLRHCATNSTNVIFTFVYDGPVDDWLVRDRVAAVEQHGGTVRWVELSARHSDLLTRVTDDSRKSHGKITDPDMLAGLLAAVSYPTVPYDDVLKVNTSTVTPELAAAHIADRFRLLP
jgi:chloramphenicol 3-O-phosphotransferase